MKMSRSRAFRIHQEAKKKRKIKKKFSHWFGEYMSDRRVGMFAKTPKMCSCFMCGNRRKHQGPTLQEIRSSDAPQD